MQLVLRVERKYTHNIHLFVIKYINIILSNLLILFSGPPFRWTRSLQA